MAFEDVQSALTNSRFVKELRTVCLLSGTTDYILSIVKVILRDMKIEYDDVNFNLRFEDGGAVRVQVSKKKVQQ